MRTRDKKSRNATKRDYILKLYVTGASKLSRNAITNLHSICNQYLEGRFDLEVVDIFQSPEKAQKDDIVAAPTLVKQLPLPTRRLVGDLSKRGRVLVLLGLKAKGREDA